MIKNELLQVFKLVSDERSFSRAADKLDMSPQLVSKYIAQLESHLNVRLLNRTTRRVHLTEAGEQCYQQAEAILEGIDNMENFFNEMQSSVRGVLNISAPVSFSTLHLPPLIKSFKSSHPKIAINLELNDRKVDVIEEGFDVALRIGHLKSSSLIAKKIAPIRLILCASPHYLEKIGPISHPNQLNGEDFLRYTYMEYGQSTQPLFQVLRAFSLNKQFGYSANNGEVLMEAAIAGEGYMLQPTFIVGEALKQGKLVTLLDDFEPDSLGLYAVYPHRKLLAPKLRAFIDHLTRYFGDVPYWDNF